MAARREAHTCFFIVGLTGTGKTTLCDKMSRRPNAHSITMESVTATCRAYQLQSGRISCDIFDTPGLCDTHGRDQSFLDNITTTMANYSKGVNKIYFCTNVNNTRFEDREKVFLEFVLRLIGADNTRFIKILFNFSDKLDADDLAGGKVQVYIKEIRDFATQLGFDGSLIGYINASKLDDSALVEDILNTPRKLRFQTKFMKEIQLNKTHEIQVILNGKVLNQEEVLLALRETQSIADENHRLRALMDDIIAEKKKVFPSCIMC